MASLILNKPRTHLIVPDQHAHYLFHNNRADWLGQLIRELRPSVVINIGDAADMPSLSSYDKGTRAFQGRNYRKDIDAHLDFQDRMWAPIKKAKKKRPYTVILEGNHEHRLKRALNLSPELEGAISFRDFDFDTYYNDIVEYEGNGPGSIEIDGVHYAHYHPSGVLLKPIGGEHAAYSLLVKRFVSSTQGHVHTADFTIRTTGDDRKIFGCVVGVFQDYWSDWAGVANKLWWRGLVVKRNVEGGCYDVQFISMDSLKKEYGV